MSRSLVHRYHYGNSGWPNPFTPEAELIYKAPRRQMEMIHLARQQIDAQKNASQEIVKSNLIGAKIIANEIEQQTEALDRTINQVGDRISSSITLAADQISDALDVLGDRICVELSEIKWQLTQQNETLEKILEVLNKSRNNEAKQLVQQGLRHYVNDEFEEAEERFKLALKFDTTDYQVLMNLAFIELNKNNSSQAFSYFKKALSLPEDIDSSTKARTLWATARLYYAENDFNTAYTYAEEAFRHDSQKDPKTLYPLGVYASLTGKKSVALESIEQAILIDPSYFTKCSVDPDLQIIKEDILQMLGRLSSNAESKAKQMVDDIQNELSVLESKNQPDSNHNFLDKTIIIINNCKAGLLNPSYSFCLRCFNTMNIMKTVVSEMGQLISLNSSSKKYQDDFDIKNKKYVSTERNIPKKGLPSEIYTIMSFISYFLPGLLGANAFASVAEGTPTAMTILGTLIWPLMFVITFFGSLVGVDEQTAFFCGCLRGLLIVGVSWGVINIIGKLMGKNYSMKNTELYRIKQTRDETERALLNTQNDITLIQENIKEQLDSVRWKVGAS